LQEDIADMRDEFWQLMIKPNVDTASALQTMSSFGPFESQIQRC
jgi:hypothetical protein